MKTLRSTLALAALLLFPSLLFASEGGINSSGSEPLPIGAGQTPAMKVFPATGGNASGSVLVGASDTPAAKLDVSGGIKVGLDETNPVSGASCTAAKQGTLSRSADTSDTNMLLCAYVVNSSPAAYKWKSLGKSTSYYSFSHTWGTFYGQWYESNALQFQGDTPQTVTAGGASCNWNGGAAPYLSINGGPWVKSGTISKGQTIKLGTFAPCADNATERVELQTGGTQTDTWDVTTTGGTWVFFSCGQCGTGGSAAGPCRLGTACYDPGDQNRGAQNGKHAYSTAVQTFGAGTGYFVTCTGDWDGGPYVCSANQTGRLFNFPPAEGYGWD